MYWSGWVNFCQNLPLPTASTTTAAPWKLASGFFLRFVHSNKNVSITLGGMPVIWGKANWCKKWQHKPQVKVILCAAVLKWPIFD